MLHQSFNGNNAKTKSGFLRHQSSFKFLAGNPTLKQSSACRLLSHSHHSQPPTPQPRAQPSAHPRSSQPWLLPHAPQPVLVVATLPGLCFYKFIPGANLC